VETNVVSQSLTARCIQRFLSATCVLLATVAASVFPASCNPRPEESAEHPGDISSRVAKQDLERLVQRNLDARVSLPESVIAARIQEWQHLPIGERIARWAELYLERGDATYVFGLKPGGYVAESLLVQDFKQDCVLFSYRCTELARASTPRDAVVWALETRFAGADPSSVVSITGAVDYDDASHLDYSLDIIRSEHWGRNVTRDVGEAETDLAGTSRYVGGSFAFIPTAKLRLERLHDGDLLYFVFDEKSDRGQRMRQEYGLVIGHQGIVRRHDGDVAVIHAAISDLTGEYSGNRVVRVPLLTYLQRVESFKGVIVTRLTE
jgi:hypothetical protein